MDIIYFDFSKAFDKVDHDRLLTKLDSVGARGQMLQWFESYLSGWKLSVRIGNHLSMPRNCPSGVPQGGSLSPILFLIYTYDLPSYLKTDPRISVAAFADDVKVYISYESSESEEATRLLNEAVSKMSTWSKEWSLPLNKKKCHIFSLNSSPLEIKFPDDSSFSPCDQMVDLGVLLSKGLC